jgi:hypothetical protein
VNSDKVIIVDEEVNDSNDIRESDESCSREQQQSTTTNSIF